ncbi:MAG: aminotransferase class IV [Bacteriovorax sp.]|jgi:branched-chain amino acid aminotransferase
MTTFLININGEYFDEQTAKISVFDRGFLYGDSVYEATRTFDRVPFRMDHHLERLFLSAKKIEFIPTLNKEEILARITETIKRSPHDNIILRIILTRGTNSDLGLDPALSSTNNLIIITKEIKPNPDWWYKTGVSMIFYQKHSTQVGSLPKSGNYQENILAHKAALLKNAYDAIMVNHEGHATEGTTSNIWIVKNGVVFTPPLADGVLEGLTRKTLFEMARSEKITIIEKSLTPDEITKADECFISSTTRNLVPVTKIEDQMIGSGLPGKMTLELLESYLRFVQISN